MVISLLQIHVLALYSIAIAQSINCALKLLLEFFAISRSFSWKIEILNLEKFTFRRGMRKILFHISARKQFHCRRFHWTVNHELRVAAPGGARRRTYIFITLPRERHVCITYIYIVSLIVPRECNDKYMYSNAKCCRSRNLTYTARQKRLLWCFYMPQCKKYLTNLWVKVADNNLDNERPRFGLVPRAHSSWRMGTSV